MQQPTRLLSNELRDQQEGKATRWAAFFDFQRAVAPCLNGCLFPTALISSCLNCRSLGGTEISLVSKRMFIPDGTPVLVTEYYILTRRNIETLNMVVCSATNVESSSCLKAPREFLRARPLQSKISLRGVTKRYSVDFLKTENTLRLFVKPQWLESAV